jgi:O-antigen ligase
VRESGGRLRAVATAVVLLLAGSLVASGSRGALIAAFVGCLFYLLAVAQRQRKLVVAGAAALFVVAALAMQLPQPATNNPDLYGTFGRTPKLGPKDLNGELPLESEFGFPGESVDTGRTRTLFFTSGRLQAWETAVQQGLDRPIAGYGFGTEDETFVDRSYLFVSRAVENSFIGVFLQLGAMGLALLVAALVLPLVAWWRVRNALDPERKEYAAACAGVVAAGLVLAVPQSYLTSVGSPPTAAFWITFFLLAALTRRSAQAGSTRG